MKSACLPVPGLLLGDYPERHAPAPGWAEAAVGLARTAAAPFDAFRRRPYRAFVAAVRRREHDTARLDPCGFGRQVASLRAALGREGFAEPCLVEAFALIREACRRVLGHMPFDTQLIAARIMLDNRVAEMATGEGKTLAAGLCALAGGLAGVPVHVITVNDYLVGRDADLLRPLCALLGLSVGHVVASHDVAARRAAYACDIVYCTAKELVFDYLRDRSVRKPSMSGLEGRAARLEGAAGGAATLLRGLCMAVVDEADSILIDEARIPLILSESRPHAGSEDFHALALARARTLQAEVHYRIDASGNPRLADAGRALLEVMPDGAPAAWRSRLHREEAVCMALAALHSYRQGHHYLVRDGKVLIIDQGTGRLAPGRAWSRGLHQMVELKEGCATSPEQVTASQITYQRFFRRYLRLGGMSGTVREARGELGAVYGLDIVTVPLRLPARRTVLPARLLRDRAALWPVVIGRVREVVAAGRPVLIGVDSVAESEELSRRLAAAGIEHAVLNARQDADEAQTVARAGVAGRVTVATNMAGRGTDIPLGPGVAGRGGLHVICCQHNSARRIDRQLIGRAARQGDPGSAETLLSLDKPGLARMFPACVAEWPLPAWLVRAVLRLPQLLAERAERLERRELLARDARAEHGFALMGAVE